MGALRDPEARSSAGHTWAHRLPLPQGYGITLGTINGLNMISSILQAIPNLEVQVLTLITWMISRFFMYSRCAARQPMIRLRGWGRWLTERTAALVLLRNWCCGGHTNMHTEGWQR